MKKGWQTRTLGELCAFENGDRGENYPSKSVQTTSGVPFINAGHLSESGIDFSDMNYIPRERFELLGNGKIRKDDILFCLRGSLGKFASVGDLSEAAIASSLVIIRPSDAILNEFVLAYLKSDLCAEMIQEFRNGAAQPNLAAASLKKFSIPVPPLAEQQRIVGLLGEAFEGLATAKANAEKNLQNARALFESHLQSVFTQRGPGWKATTLGAEIDLLAGFAFKSARYTNDDDDIRLLRGDNIIQGCLRWDDVKRWPADDTGDYDRYQLAEGDVVLAMDRPWVKAGLKHATISADDLPCLLVQRTARLRGGANLDNHFLKLLIGSGAFTSHILGVQTGIGVPHISGQQIKDFEFARPPVTEQRRIADNLESLREETQRLARLYERKQAALEALKKSLLHQAFTGEL